MDPGWLLLIEIGPTCSAIKIIRILAGACKARKFLELVASRGLLIASIMGKIESEMPVWLSKDLIANPLCLYQLAKHFRIVCDTGVEDTSRANYAPKMHEIKSLWPRLAHI